MNKIKLTQGKYALVDDEDYEYLNQWKWYVRNDNDNWYAVRNKRVGDKQKTILMHRVILEVNNNQSVDHINNDSLDNRLENLQIITHRENVNKDKKGGTSKYRGVSLTANGRWQARISKKLKTKRLGTL